MNESAALEIPPSALQIGCMNTTRPASPTGDLQSIQVLAHLLQRLEENPRAIDAAQYRTVALSLGLMLDRAAPGQELSALLELFPAAAELYENRRYEQAGLCRSPLELAARAEVEARGLLARSAAPAS